jgi:hypothetical protein
LLVKHLKKICCVCGGHFISMNFLLRIWEGYYAYSSKVYLGSFMVGVSKREKGLKNFLKLFFINNIYMKQI